MSIIRKECIRADVEVRDWEDAIRKAGQILLEVGSIKGGYIDSMVNMVKDLGPYIVIAPHIAIAHARPEGNVCRDDMSLLLLRNEVNFNCENDPVKIVICLAAVDGKEHIGLLQKLAIMLDEDTCEGMMNCRNEQELEALLDRY